MACFFTHLFGTVVVCGKGRKLPDSHLLQCKQVCSLSLPNSGRAYDCKAAVGAESSVQMTKPEAKVEKGPCVEGWFKDRAPDAWLAQLYTSLPARSRLALFRSSPMLGRVITRNAQRIRLRFPPLPRRKLRLPYSKQQDDWYKFAQRGFALTDLLCGCNNLEVVVDTQQLQPSLSGVSEGITALLEEHGGSGMAVRAGSNLNRFTRMPNLRVLAQGSGTELEDISKLCDALEAGQLPHLHSLGFMYRFQYHGDTDEQRAVIQCLAAAAGSQIVDLTTSCVQLIHELPRFTKLQAAKLSGMSLGQTTSQYLLEHATIRTVTLGGGAVRVDHDNSKCKCTWDTLVLHNMYPDVLTKMPLSGLHEIRLLHGVSCLNSFCAFSNAGIQAALDQPNLNVVCLPDPSAAGTGIFHVQGFSDQYNKLIARIQGAHTLHLHGAPCQFDPNILPEVWAAVPICVSHIIWEFWQGSFHQWDALWQGWPAHVTSLMLVLSDKHNNDEAALMQLIKTTPLHVSKLVLSRSWHAFRGAFCNELHLAAPAHVKLVVKPWGLPPVGRPW